MRKYPTTKSLSDVFSHPRVDEARDRFQRACTSSTMQQYPLLGEDMEAIRIADIANARVEFLNGATPLTCLFTDCFLDFGNSHALKAAAILACLRRPVNVRAGERNGITLLHQVDYPETIGPLLARVRSRQRAAYLNARVPASGETALHRQATGFRPEDPSAGAATALRQMGCIEALLKAGADPSVVDKAGRTAEEQARVLGRMELVAVFERHMLQRAGAPAAAPTDDFDSNQISRRPGAPTRVM